MNEEKKNKFENLTENIFIFMLFLFPCTLIGSILGFIDDDDQFSENLFSVGFYLGIMKALVYLSLLFLIIFGCLIFSSYNIEILLKNPVTYAIGIDTLGSFLIFPITYGLGKVTRKISNVLSKVTKSVVSNLKKKHIKSIEIKKEKERIAAKDYLFNPEDMKVINKEEVKEKSHLEQIQKELNDCKKYKEELTIPITSALEEDKVLGLK